MRRVARAGILCGALTIATSLSAAADTSASVAQPSASKSSPSAASNQSGASSQSATSAPRNPLREPDSGSKPSAPPEPAGAVPPRLPATGRLRLFRSTEKPVTAEPNWAPPTGAPTDRIEGAGVFPHGTPAALVPMLRESRFEDVARGLVLVPVTPPTSAALPSTTKQASPQPALPSSASPPTAVQAPPPEPARTAAASAQQPAADPAVKRLPPVSRTGAPPLLRPGTKLPQEPILIYPETGQ